MIKCPRCNLPQEESPQCEYCGLMFKDFDESAKAPRAARLNRTALFAIALTVAGVLIASYWFISSPSKTDAGSTDVAEPGASFRETTNDDLKTAAKELTGDLGIIDSFKDGSTKGSIIAMAFFSLVGMGYFAYGKKSQKILMLICGIALMVYSYFVDGTVYIVIVGTGLSALPFLFGR
jgi:hypothetical protein